MTDMDILDAIGGLDGDMLEDTDALRRTGGRGRVRLHRLALAACVGIIAAALLPLALGGGPTPEPSRDPSPEGPAASEPSVTPSTPAEPLDPEPPEPPTSEKYSGLEDLLAYLSGHEEHSDGRNKDGGVSLPGETAEDITLGAQAVEFGDIYHIDGGQVYAVPWEGGGGSPVETEGRALELFISASNLVTVGDAGGQDPGDDPWVSVTITDLSTQDGPELRHLIAQSGTLTAAYMEPDGRTLTLITADGQCACGWSRLEDVSGYVPRLMVDGVPTPWEEDSISVLGEPGQVMYAAVTRVDTMTGGILSRRAMYGDISRVLSGAGWLGIVTDGDAAPVMYVFVDGGSCDLRFKGRLDPSSAGVPMSIDEVTMSAGRLRVLGSGGKQRGEIRAAVAGVEELDNVTVAGFESEGVVSISDVLWEGDRAILAVEEMELMGDDVETRDRILTADFSGAAPELSDTGLSMDCVAGIDGVVWYGRPLGFIDTLIPLGDGTYMRFDLGPRGFDIFTLTGAPRFLCRSAGELGEDERLTFNWFPYRDNTLLVGHLTPGEDDRLATSAEDWLLLRISPDSPEPITILSRYPSGTPIRIQNSIFILTPDSIIPVTPPTGQ